jgi:HEAT repeat protein
MELDVVHLQEEIERQLKSGDVPARLNIVKSLLGKNDEASIGCIIEAMGDSEWQIRKEAVAVLSKAADKTQIVHTLIERISNNDNVGRRNAAAELFVHWGKVAVEPLLFHLKKVNEDTQKVLIDTLGDIRDTRAIPSLLSDILGEGSLEEASAGFADNLRSAALEALGKLCPPDGVVQIIPFLSKGNPLLTFSAIKALELIGSPLAAPKLIEVSKEKMFQRAALEALGVIADLSAIDCLLASFHSPSENIRRVALKAIIRLELKQTEKNKQQVWQSVKAIYNDQDYTFLLSMTGHSEPLLKGGAIRVLGWVSEVRSVPTLVSFLNDYNDDVVTAFIAMGPSILPELGKLLDRGVWENEKTRLAVATVWGEIVHPEGVGLLIDLLRDNAMPVRKAAAHALEKTRSKEAIMPLIALLKDPYHEVQEIARQTLLTMKADLPKDELIQILGEQSASLRANAALLLGEIGHQPAMSHLVFLLKDSDEEVRRAAVSALGSFLPLPQAVKSILTALGDEDYRVRVAVLKALETIPVDPLLNDLSSLVYDENIWVRSALARTIGSIASKEGLQILLRLSEDSTGVVRISALLALGHRREPAILDLIRKHLTSEDRDVKKAAIVALGTLGDPNAIPLIAPFLDNPYWELRAAAAVTMGGLRAASDKLLEMAHSDEDPLVRDAARSALSHPDKTVS